MKINELKDGDRVRVVACDKACHGEECVGKEAVIRVGKAWHDWSHECNGCSDRDAEYELLVKPAFKVGDRVRVTGPGCRSVHECPAIGKTGTLGEIITQKCARVDYDTPTGACPHNKVHAERCWFDPSAFELLPAFKVGDRVRANSRCVYHDQEGNIVAVELLGNGDSAYRVKFDGDDRTTWEPAKHLDLVVVKPVEEAEHVFNVGDTVEILSLPCVGDHCNCTGMTGKVERDLGGKFGVTCVTCGVTVNGKTCNFKPERLRLIEPITAFTVGDKVRFIAPSVFAGQHGIVDEVSPCSGSWSYRVAFADGSGNQMESADYIEKVEDEKPKTKTAFIMVGDKVRVVRNTAGRVDYCHECVANHVGVVVHDGKSCTPVNSTSVKFDDLKCSRRAFPHGCGGILLFNPDELEKVPVVVSNDDKLPKKKWKSEDHFKGHGTRRVDSIINNAQDDSFSILIAQEAGVKIHYCVEDSCGAANLATADHCRKCGAQYTRKKRWRVNIGKGLVYKNVPCTLGEHVKQRMQEAKRDDREKAKVARAARIKAFRQHLRAAWKALRGDA